MERLPEIERVSRQLDKIGLTRGLRVPVPGLTPLPLREETKGGEGGDGGGVMHDEILVVKSDMLLQLCP